MMRPNNAQPGGDAPVSLPELLARLRDGDRALLDYLDELEARFATVEPNVLAFVPEDGRFDRLRREARQLLEQFPGERPPLFGLPVGVKDIFHVDGFVTRAGSRLPVELLQGSQAESVSGLRRAGALILGKTVTTEFAYFGPGPTRNPHATRHTPGGSSSGSAAAVAAGLCPLALGTQTIGSIIRPAAFCGVVGYKPSYGRVSAEGVIPLSVSLDHVGTFTNDVAGAAVVAHFLCRDWREEPEQTAKPVLGIPGGEFLEQADEDGLAQFRADCERLAAAGFTIRTVENAMPDFAEIRDQHRALVAAETARFHDRWFAAHETLYHEKTAELIRQGQGFGDDEIEQARSRRATTREQLGALMDDHGIDLWLCPPAKGAAPRGLESTGDPIMNLPWTNAGMPALSLPTAVNEDGLPLGLQLVGRPRGDERLLAFAPAVERVFSEQ